MRGKGQPRLENKRDDTSPVEQSAHHCDLHNHIVEMDVIHNEWESVHQCKEEEGISGPSVEHLDLLVRYSCAECDPISFARSSTAKCQFIVAGFLRKHTKQMACKLMPSSRTWFPVVVTHQNLHLTSSKAVESAPYLYHS